MKKILYLAAIILLAFANSVQAQDSPKTDNPKDNCDCANENFQLPDGVKYLKAQKDALEMKLIEKRPLQAISDGDVDFLYLSKGAANGNCTFNKGELDNFQKGGFWLFLPNEFKDVYKNKKDEFTSLGIGKRLERLLGLPPNYDSKCIVEIKISSNKVVRPSIIPKNNETSNYFYKKWDGTSVFTSLGYTCDWYYGDGCEYGLTEFNIPPPPEMPKCDCPKKEDKKEKEKYLEITGSCTVEEYITNGKCPK